MKTHTTWLVAQLAVTLVAAESRKLDSELLTAESSKLAQTQSDLSYIDCHFCASWHAEAYFFYLADSYDDAVCNSYAVQCGDYNKLLSRTEFLQAFKFVISEYPTYMRGDCPAEPALINTLFDQINSQKEESPNRPQTLDKKEIHQWWHTFTDCSNYELDPY